MNDQDSGNQSQELSTGSTENLAAVEATDGVTGQPTERPHTKTQKPLARISERYASTGKWGICSNHFGVHCERLTCEAIQC